MEGAFAEHSLYGMQRCCAAHLGFAQEGIKARLSLWSGCLESSASSESSVTRLLESLWEWSSSRARWWQRQPLISSCLRSFRRESQHTNRISHPSCCFDWGWPGLHKIWPVPRPGCSAYFCAGLAFKWLEVMMSTRVDSYRHPHVSSSNWSTMQYSRYRKCVCAHTIDIPRAARTNTWAIIG